MDEAAIVVGVIGVAVLGAVFGVPLAAIALAAVAVRRRLGTIAGRLAAIGLLTAYLASPLFRVVPGVLMFTVPPTRLPLANLDLMISRGAREEVVRVATAQKLAQGEFVGQYVMPSSASGLSVWGDVQVIDQRCGQLVFFMTLTGFSPDPYAGFEHVPEGCAPEPDPLGSGAGTATPIDGPWY